MISKSISVFIVDDDVDDQYFIKEALNELEPSIVCYTAVNGQEGLEKLYTGAIPTPSFILLDLNMPRINGFQFLHHVKSNPELKHIPVIIYSTSSNQHDIDKSLQSGAWRYLIKQPDFNILQKQLMSILTLIPTV